MAIRSADMAILNFGSLNIDYVYRVGHIVRPGETLPSQSFEVFAGGKGANQSVAAAKAGAKIRHAGKVGEDGRWLIDKLVAVGVETGLIGVGDGRTGHAIIQVDDSGQNAIVLHAGANHHIERNQIDRAIGNAEAGDVLLLQNEINDIAYLIERGHKARLAVCFNPAPFDQDVLDYPLELVDTFVVNETEAAGLSGKSSAGKSLAVLAQRFGGAKIILTLGDKGVSYRCGDEAIDVPAVRVDAVDTTAAGDTFIGYYLAAQTQGLDIRKCLELATRAAAICVSKAGAMDSIPGRQELT